MRKRVEERKMKGAGAERAGGERGDEEEEVKQQQSDEGRLLCEI